MSKHTPGPWTVQHVPGGELTGVDAEIAALEDCEPFARSVVSIPETSFERAFDPRRDGETERALADGAMHAAAPQLRAALETIDAMPFYLEPVADAENSGLRARYNKALKVARAALKAADGGE